MNCISGILIFGILLNAAILLILSQSYVYKDKETLSLVDEENNDKIKRVFKVLEDYIP